jgi:pimeloyl-ACP methyl ester carboxylesterase
VPHLTTSDGCTIYWEEGGRGEPLLLLSGAGSSSEMWSDVRQAFERRHHVLVYDYRGVGKSDAPTEPPYSAEMFAADAIAVLDAAGTPRAHVYGGSMGGFVAQRLALSYPHRVGAVVLGCTSVGKRGEPRPEESAARMRGEGDPAERLQGMTDTLFTPAFQATEPEVVARFMQRVLRPKAPHVVPYHMGVRDNFDSWDELPSITAPVLVIHGTDDRVSPVRNAHLLAERIPGVELHIIEGGRHGYLIEYHPEITDFVLDFLARHPLENRPVEPRSGHTG